ncbi:hypothetical protein ACWEPO_16105 [Streptomyces albidoflavus]
MIQQGNGHTGEAHGFAANLAKGEAHSLACGPRATHPTPVPAQNPLRADTGRHRAPPTTGSGRSQPRAVAGAVSTSTTWRGKRRSPASAEAGPLQEGTGVCRALHRSSTVKTKGPDPERPDLSWLAGSQNHQRGAASPTTR